MTITSFDNKKIKNARLLVEKAKARKEQDAFVTEGVKLFMEAQKEEIISVFVCEGQQFDDDVTEKLNEVGFDFVTPEVFKKLSDTVTSQGIMSIMKMRHFKASDFIKKDGLYLVLETIQDPGNLGTIMRTAEGAGVDCVFMSNDCVDLYNPKTVRSTMGSIFRQPFVIGAVGELISELKAQGVFCYAAHLKGEKNCWDFDYKKGTAFLIGNEGNGLTKETADMADAYLRIPMSGRLESLNAAVSAALLTYEAKRQRT